MTEKDGLAYFQKAADSNSGDAMTMLAVFYANGKGGVDKNLARAVALCDEIDMPETVWMEMTSPEQRTGMIATTTQEIIHERLRKGGDADARVTLSCTIRSRRTRRWARNEYVLGA